MLIGSARPLLLKSRLSLGIGFIIGGLATRAMAKRLERPGDPPATAFGAPARLLAGLTIGLGAVFVLANFFVASDTD